MNGMAIGSTGYMSPEQARGAAVDARSDLYSLAVLAFEMLTGRLPFDGPDALAVALAQVEQPVPTLPPTLSHWQPLFDRALASDPTARYHRCRRHARCAAGAAIEPARATPDDEGGNQRALCSPLPP
jgi:serine/threonine-protein kinase PpkA